MRLPMLACVLAACTPDVPTGVTVEIAPMDGVVSVELFVGTKVSSGSSGAPGHTAESAELFEVLHANDGPWTITPTKSESFLLQNDTETEFKIHMLAAVGYDAKGAPIAAFRQRDVYIQPGMTERWRLELSPATEIIPNDNGEADEFRVRAWTRMRDPSTPSCVQIEHGHELYAFGPKGDTDCDEVAPTAGEECAPWIHLAEGVAPSGGFGSAVCGTKVAVDPAFPVACLAGARACNEVSATTDLTCVPLAGEFCVTSDLCNCPTWDATCQALALPPVTSYVTCSVCADSVMYPAVDLRPILGASPSSCTDVRIRALAGTGGFSDEAVFATGRRLDKVGGSGCSVDLAFSSTRGLDRDIALVSLDLDSTADGNHIVVPLYLYYEAACDVNEQVCVVHAKPADPSRLCAAPPSVTTCGPDAICDTGPYCDGRCCAPGERCDGGVCVCGNMYGGCTNESTCQAGGSPGTGPCGSECCGGSTGVLCTF